MVRGTRRRRPRTSGGAGQSLVEFALTLPIFVLLMMGVLEFGFLYNNILTVQYAARQGVSAAAQAGGVDGGGLLDPQGGRAQPHRADRQDPGHVGQDLQVRRATAIRSPAPSTSTSAVGTLDCPGDVDQPYTLVGSEGYPQATRHDSLAEGLDVVGVRIGYHLRRDHPDRLRPDLAVSDGASLRMEPKQ